MREIKFRAWFTSKDGAPLPGQKCSMQDYRSLHDFLTAVEDVSSEYGHNFILMQFTGLKDKNGKEIYEGDIVKSQWQHDSVTCYDYEVVGVIKWNKEEARFILQFDNNVGTTTFEYPLISFDREELLDDEFEVIGNIYENHELLTTTEIA